MEEIKRAPRNRTLTLSEEETKFYSKKIEKLPVQKIIHSECEDKIFNCDLLSLIPLLPEKSVDLMIIDPPYNLNKDFGNVKFAGRSEQAYDEYLESWFPLLMPLLKDNASLYLCGDWKCSNSLYKIAQKSLKVQNRITWQREKGRGAAHNWKNCTEDIWFATKNDDYYFDIEAVKQKRRVIAPYKENGKPKDWEDTEEGKYRLTCPSNFWDDISVPFWSMPENTDHPTQKPEKLIAKLILASSKAGDVVFDPFMGSGTTAVVAKKLGRKFFGAEINSEYCMWALKRLDMAETDKTVQGYEDGVFYERNSGK
ncbi:MAG: site-specific DNA-methyltransferase [Treponema sp.]|nr:site-specific DNA-methyltransferase [Treponema sp.]